MNLIHGNCKEVLKTLPDCSVDSVVTDPPYELGFMGKKWDASGIAYDIEMWSEVLRVLKPGGHLLAFSGSRTYHRMTCAIEDAGFEVRDQIMWVYGSGFPKSHNLQGKWQGWGTALKPAHEPICVARKPLIGTVAENVLAHGTGALNIDGCRVPGALEGDPLRFAKTNGGEFVAKFDDVPVVRADGRWPANLIHDGSDEVLAEFPDTGSAKPARTGAKGGSGFGHFDDKKTAETIGNWPADTGGSAARFFYCAKASKKDRDAGLEGFEVKQVGTYAQDEWSRQNMGNTPDALRSGRANTHPTVKPTDLMRYLCRLVTPPSGVVLDPFMGSGSTGKAAVLEGFDFIGIDMTPEYIEIAKARIQSATPANDNQQPDLFKTA